MTGKIKNSLRNAGKKVAVAAVVGVVSASSLLPFSSAQAGEGGSGGLCKTRYRVEQTSNPNTGNNLTKTTFGFAENPNSDYLQESFRVYNYDNSGDGNDYTVVGGELPSFNIGGLENKTEVFGSFGDKEEMGFQSDFSRGENTFHLNYGDSETTDTTRLGISGERNLTDKLTLGAGYDNVDSKGSETDYFLVNAIYDATENDQFGGAVRVADSEAGDTNTALGYWCHYGPDQDWGHRTRMRADVPENGNVRYGGESIIAQNPTFSRFSSPWMVRSHSEGMFSVPYPIAGTAENPLGVERTPLADRTKGGCATAINWSYAPESDSGSISVEAGYKFNITDDASLTLTASSRRSFPNGDENFGGRAHFTYETEVGNFYAEFSGNDEGKTYGSIGYSCGLPNVFGRDVR